MEPMNDFHRSVATPPPGGWKISYRQTPPGQPDVTAILHPGDEIEISRSTCGALGTETRTVHEVRGPYTYADPGHEYPWFSIALRGDDGKYTGHINECVAVDGEIRGLFEANDLRIRLLKRGAGPDRAGEQLRLF